MNYRPRNKDSRKNDEAALYDSLEPVVSGLGMSLIELNLFRQRGGSVQVKTVICKDGTVGLDDCSRVHRALLPRLELAFGGQDVSRDISLEVSSPGIDRVIKDGSEFAHYIGRRIKCYRTDISDWTTGVLLSADEQKIVIRAEGGEMPLAYEIIGKARLEEDEHWQQICRKRSGN